MAAGQAIEPPCGLKIAVLHQIIAVTTKEKPFP